MGFLGPLVKSSSIRSFELACLMLGCVKGVWKYDGFKNQILKVESECPVTKKLLFRFVADRMW